MGEFYRYLGYQIDYNREKCFIYISQGDFIIRSLEKYDYGDLNPVKNLWPFDIQIPKVWNLVENIDVKGYMSEMAMLNFVIIIIRPDIQYTTNRLVEINKGLTKEHVVMLKYLWRYMAGTKSLGLRASGR